MRRQPALEAARLECGFTQDQLAEAADVSRETIMRAERNPSETKAKTALAIVDALNRPSPDDDPWLTGEVLCRA